MELIMLVLSSQKRQQILPKQYGIKVYTIGIGTNGMARISYAVAQMVSFIPDDESGN
jgi:hypothetical protein